MEIVEPETFTDLDAMVELHLSNKQMKPWKMKWPLICLFSRS